MAMIDTRRWSPVARVQQPGGSDPPAGLSTPLGNRSLRVAALGLLGILTILGASSCGEFRFEEQEILFRCDSWGDRLELLILTQGLGARDPWAETSPPEDPESKRREDLGRARRALEPMAEGRRRLVLLDPMFDFDLDGDSGPETEGEALDAELERRVRAFVNGIEVLDAGLFLDESRRLGLFQRVRIQGIGDGIALLNEACCFGIRHNLETWVHETGRSEMEYVAERYPFLDEASRALYLAKAHADEPWVRLEGDRIVLDLPVSRDSAIRLLSRASQAAAEQEAQGKLQGLVLLASLLRHVEDLELGEGGLRLVLAPGPDGSFALRIRHPAGESQALRDLMVGRGAAPVAEDLDLKELRGTLGGAQGL